ncbi:MAG: glycosyltransferase [Candidatus Bathyarchaeia archaeon]
MREDPRMRVQEVYLNPMLYASFHFSEPQPKVKPKISIGVCVRNCEGSIEEAFRSLLGQQFPHALMELIFVDDGSEDNTLSIVRDLASKTSIPTRVYHTTWLGIGHARNIVIDYALGQYIVWVDGDMVLSNDYIQKLVELMDSNPDLGIAKGKQSLEPVGNRLAILETYARAASRMVDYRSNPDPSKALGTGGAIYRADTIKQVGHFDETLRGYGEDWDFELRARAAGWSLCAVDVNFTDYERKGVTWGSLWRRYWLRGYHTRYFLHKHRGLIKHTRMNPPVSFFAGLLQSRPLFRKTRQKIVFLLPFEYLFKTTAWYVGFLNSHSGSHV